MVRCNFLGVIMFVFISAGITGQYDICTGQLDTIGDGRCDSGNNSPECNFDGGDCCECSCMNDRHYPCGISGFNCSDPDVLVSAGSCQSKTAYVNPCTTNLSQTWLVKDTASAKSLAEAVNCSGGTFYVTWRGSVLVNQTIHIPDGTTLNVTGEGSGAEVNRGGKTRLFMPVGAELHIDGLILSNGNATYGGAIAATRSRVGLNQTSCSDNIASSYGGAIYVGVSSTLAWEGHTVLTRNHAGRGGGAVAVSMSSSATWSGKAKHYFNTASFGGAIYVNKHSSLLLDGETSFVDNTASYDGGTLYVYDGSSIMWHGETSFISNEAGEKGGALYGYWDSIISWDGDTSFINNTGSWAGGALGLASDSNASWAGKTSFVNNTAQNGGALHVLFNSTVSWGGKTSFVDNTASTDGGTLYVYSDSIVSWGGETSFVNNAAGEKGGALYVYWDSIISWDGETSFINNSATWAGGALGVSSDSIVSWHGKTSFVDNTAQYGGASHVLVNSSVLWDEETSFVNNTASYDGGVLYVYSDSIVSWDGETSFVNNAAGEKGGSLYVYWDSIISWDGTTSFINNSATWAGGALGVSSDSIVSWHGKTSFVDNTAQYGGASHVLVNSSVLWDGETSFVNNTASYDGGTLYVYSDSIASWDGKTSFVNNTAGKDGGAMYVYNESSVSWDGTTSFVDNMANDGGALFVFVNSNVSWDGETSFVDNTASGLGGAFYVNLESIVTWMGRTSFTGNHAYSLGGAICVVTSSNITMGGDTNFTDNEAATDGGAAYVSSSYFIVKNNTTVLFLNNYGGGNGGAIAFIGDAFTRFPPSVTFWGNAAGAAGGAIYMSGVNVGMLFEGTRFMSNSALIGGGLYSTGSGIAVTEDDERNREYFPTTLIGCEYIGNEAMKTGGAMDSGGGSDMIVNTSFVGNTASLGGALRLVGRTSLIGCEFVENLSGEDEGPGISNDGIISSISRSTFVDNVFNCLMGFFLDYNKTTAHFDTVCKGCDTTCSQCTVEGKEPMCLEALEHSSSGGGNTKLESLLIERGYWRATNTSMDILACYKAEACLGGLTGKQDYCDKGYEGPYCSVCSKGYTKSLGFACNKCSDNVAGGIALAVVMAAVFVLVFIAFLSYMLSGKMGDADKGIVARVTRFIPLQSVKIIIVVWQILTQFSAVANVVFPSVYQRFLDGVDILNFDLSWALSAECIIDTDFHDQLLLVTLGPFLCMVILGGTYITAMRRSSTSEEARGIVRRKHLSMVLLLTFLVYSSVSSTLFKTFACDKLDDGKNYLRADYRIECDSSKHKALAIYAGFMVVLYVVGIPAFYGVILYINREALMDITDREEDERIKPITDLKPYRPDRFYYEVIECARRVMLTSALVFIYPNTAAQIAVALMMATFFIFISEAFAPYASPWDMWSSRTGHAIVYTSIFLALLLKVDVSGERTRSQRVFESVLIAAHSCLILIVVVEATAMVMVWRNEVKEDSQPRIRPSLSVSSLAVGRDEVS